MSGVDTQYRLPERMISFENYLEHADEMKRVSMISGERRPTSQKEMIDFAIQGRERVLKASGQVQINLMLRHGAYLRISPESQKSWNNQLRTNYKINDDRLIQLIIIGAALPCLVHVSEFSIVNVSKPEDLESPVLPAEKMNFHKILQEHMKHYKLSEDDVLFKIGDMVLKDLLPSENKPVLDGRILQASTLRTDAAEVESLTLRLLKQFQDPEVVRGTIATIAWFGFTRGIFIPHNTLLGLKVLNSASFLYTTIAGIYQRGSKSMK